MDGPRESRAHRQSYVVAAQGQSPRETQAAPAPTVGIAAADLETELGVEAEFGSSVEQMGVPPVNIELDVAFGTDQTTGDQEQTWLQGWRRGDGLVPMLGFGEGRAQRDGKEDETPE